MSEVPISRSIEGFCAAYGVGRAYAYALLARGELEGRKVGKKTVILEESAQRWFAKLADYGGDDGSRLRQNGRFVKGQDSAG